MSGATEARIAAVLDRIVRHDDVLNCFTAILAEQALAEARAQDARGTAGDASLPLAGVPFAVKNLFDVKGVTTLAGSKILAEQPPATADAFVVRQLRKAGGILVGCLNMDEFAYGFSTENAHHGRTRNPHDPQRMAGGSSGGSAAAVAAGLVPLALGSDTNGSIRVPASLCGVFGLKPTYGRLLRAGTYPFVSSFDHVGPFTRTVHELALAYDCMQGDDPDDAVQAMRGVEPTAPLAPAPPGLRVARLRGWFERGSPEAAAAVDRVAEALGGAGGLELPGTETARSAAFCISASEGGALHLPRLSVRAMDYDPATRERLLAGALLPGAVMVQAQRFRSWYRSRVLAAFEQYDVLLAPATPCAAPRFDDPTILLDGVPVPARANLGLFAQPLSFIGLPVVTLPVCLPGALPIGVQLITRPFAESLGLRVAARLEADGVVGCTMLDYA